MQLIRNIAIIAHVDHGKTTLVDRIIQECQVLDQRKEAGDLILDSNDLERERGITILSKNVSVNYKGVKINIIDTPGHADFGGEVERVLKMADGVLLLVDAILKEIQEPAYIEGTAQMQVASLDFSSYVGRIAIGRVFRGNITTGLDYTLCKRDGKVKKVRVKELYVFEGLGRVKTDSVRCGDLCAVIGLEDFEIGDTLADLLAPEALQRIEVDEPTMSMVFTINNSPMYGKEGKFVTSRHLRTRLIRETEKNLALKVEETKSEDTFNVFG